jgi:8-oxo-dGTP pyrophosphatase MutT (NUDIX family)
MGVACAVINEQEQILLSQRGDLGVWNLPSGRLDSHEHLADAAVREVREETGIDAQITRPLGLYYYAGWRRLNVLFLAQPIGGSLQQKTYETRANTFFAAAHLPEQLLDKHAIQIAFIHGEALHIVTTPLAEMRRLQRKFALRWISNLLRGRPEPRYPRFGVQASLIIQNTNDAILTVPDKTGKRIPPGITCSGSDAPWEQICKYVRDTYALYELRQAHLRWVGLYENAPQNRIEFIFATRVQVESALTEKSLAWTPADSPLWWYGYKPYVAHLMQSSNHVLTLHHLPEKDTL